MTEGFFKASGAVVFWSPSEWVDREKLNRGLEMLSLGHATLEERTPYACLKNAVEANFRSKNYLCQPLDDTVAFEVVEVLRGVTNNAYSQKFRVSVPDPKNAPLTLQMSPYDSEQAAQLAASYGRFRSLVRGSAVTTTIVKIIEGWSGSRLRPSGSIYWLPEGRLDQWHGLGAVLEMASQGGFRSYTMRVHHDVDSVRAIRDALAHEVKEEAKRIKEEVMSGELKARALESRKMEAILLRQKVRLYESLLEEGLSDLGDVALDAETAAADAALSLAAGLEV